MPCWFYHVFRWCVQIFRPLASFSFLLLSYGSLCLYKLLYNTCLYSSILSTCVLTTCFSFAFSFLFDTSLFGSDCLRANSCWWWIWRKFCSPRELRSRTIHIGRPCEEKYPPNEIRNQVSVLQIISIYFPSRELAIFVWRLIIINVLWYQ